MPKTRPPHTPKFRRRPIELVRKGPSPGEVARQVEPSAQTIRNRLRQANRDAGRRTDGPTTDDREKLRRLPRETRCSARSAKCHKEPKPRLRGIPARSRPRIRVRAGAQGRASRRDDVSRAGCLPSGYDARRRGPLSGRCRVAVGSRASGCQDGRAGRGDPRPLAWDVYGAPRVHAQSGPRASRSAASARGAADARGGPEASGGGRG